MVGQVLQWQPYQVGVGRHGNEGAVTVAEGINEDPRTGGADWADGAVGRQCEFGESISVYSTSPR